jgi:hypothetical protein
MQKLMSAKSTHPLGDTTYHFVKANVLNAVQDEEIASLKMDRDFEHERGNWYRDKLQASEQSIKRLKEALEAVAKIIGPPGKSTWVTDDELHHAWALYILAKEIKP